MFTNTFAKEVQTTLPSHSRDIYIFEEEKITISQALLLSAPAQAYTYIDEYSRLLHWNMTISKPKGKSLN